MNGGILRFYRESLAMLFFADEMGLRRHWSNVCAGRVKTEQDDLLLVFSHS